MQYFDCQGGLVNRQTCIYVLEKKDWSAQEDRVVPSMPLLRETCWGKKESVARAKSANLVKVK